MSRVWFRWLLLVLALACFAFALFAGLRTILFLRESEITIPASTVHRGSLSVEAARVEIEGDVLGDVEVSSLYMKQLGEVSGSTFISSGLVELRGHSHGNVLIRAANARVYGTIDGNVTFQGGTLQIMEGAHIGGDLDFKGGQLTVVATSSIGEDLRAVAIAVTIEGQITGNVAVSSRMVSITDGSIVNGSVTYESSSPIQIGDSAQIDGSVRSEQLPGTGFAGNRLFRQWGLAAVLLVVLVSGLFAIRRPRVDVLPVQTRLRSLALIIPGFGLVAAGPVLLMLLAMYLLTIPLVMLGALTYAILLVWVLGRGVLLVGWMLLPGKLRNHGIVNVICGSCVFGLIASISPRFVLAPLLFGSLGAGAWLWQQTSGNAIARQPRSGCLLAGTAGFGFVTVGIVAVSLGAIASIAAVITLTGSAALVWEYSPFTLGAIAWLLATCSLALCLFAWEQTSPMDSTEH